MELSDLAAYAEEKYHIEEQHKWADFPGFSVLNDPHTGNSVSLPNFHSFCAASFNTVYDAHFDFSFFGMMVLLFSSAMPQDSLIRL